MFAQMTSHPPSAHDFPKYLIDKTLPWLQGQGTTFQHQDHNPLDIDEIRSSFRDRLISGRPSQQDLFELLWRLSNHASREKPLRFKLGYCRSCGEALVYETLDGRRWSGVGSCSRAARLPARAEIDVPSGILLFHHDLRPFLTPIPERGWVGEEEHRLNGLGAESLPGITALLRFYAREGVLRLPIRSHASLIPTTKSRDKSWDIADPGLAALHRPATGWRQLISGHDLLMVADSCLAHPFPSMLAEATQVSCEPGRYRLTVRSEAYEGARRAPVTYASLERIGSC